MEKSIPRFILKGITMDISISINEGNYFNGAILLDNKLNKEFQKSHEYITPQIIDVICFLDNIYDNINDEFTTTAKSYEKCFINSISFTKDYFEIVIGSEPNYRGDNACFRFSFNYYEISVLISELSDDNNYIIMEIIKRGTDIENRLPEVYAEFKIIV